MAKSQMVLEELNSYISQNFPQGIDMARLKEDVQNGKNISLQDLEKYALDKPKQETVEKKGPEVREDLAKTENKPGFSSDTLHFDFKEKDGRFCIEGSNGVKFTAKTMDEMHAAVAKQFLLHAAKSKKNVKDASVRFELYPWGKNKKEHKEAFARNFIKAGIAVEGDVPENPKFWENLKKEFLKNPSNDEKKWAHLTRYVPSEYMVKEEKNQAQSRLFDRQEMRQ